MWSPMHCPTRLRPRMPSSGMKAPLLIQTQVRERLRVSLITTAHAGAARDRKSDASAVCGV